MKRYLYLLFALLMGAASPEQELYRAYQLSEGTPEERAQALQIYETLARQGNAEAQTEYGTKFYFGDGTTINYNQSFYWFQKAAEQGYGRAMYYLGRSYHHGYGPQKNESLYLHWLRKGAEAGHSSSQELLAEELIEGKLLPANNKEALSWLKKAAASGVERMRRLYAYHLLVGDLGEQNIPWAVTELEALMASGSDNARIILAQRALLGLHGSPKDPQRAIELAMPLAEKEDPEACAIVGDAYTDLPTGQETANYQKAKYWLTRPGEKMTDEARALMLENALLFNLDNPEEGVKQIRHWFRQMTDRNRADAILFGMVKQWFLSQHPFLIPNASTLLNDLMVDHYPQGELLRSELGIYGFGSYTPWQIAGGYLHAAPHIAEARESARLLVKGDWDRIFALLPIEPWQRKITKQESAEPLLPDAETLQKEAEKGDTLAMWQLALSGIDADGKPGESARSWMKRAAEGGFVAAQILLAWENDRSKPRDEAAAHSWWEKVANSGSEYGRYHLALHLVFVHNSNKELDAKAESLLQELVNKDRHLARVATTIRILFGTQDESGLKQLEPLLEPLAAAGSLYAGHTLVKFLLTEAPLTAAHLAKARNLLTEMAKRDVPVNPILQAIAADLTPEGTPLAEEAGEEVVRWLLEYLPDLPLGEILGELGTSFLSPKRYALHRLGLVWQKRAARLGNAAAMKRLGHLHLLGYIVDIDTEAARQWYEKAAATGDDEAAQLAALLARKAVDPARDRVPPEACWYTREPDKYWFDLDMAKMLNTP
ncbi:MAG: sel1 repeat family protein [Magnetococcales bacterium]|nr:sel1 repeat family protein [Magnetococcales bacterium]